MRPSLTQNLSTQTYSQLLPLSDPSGEVRMSRMDWKNNLRICGLAVALAAAGAASLLPVAPALAQSAPQPRSLPDFTDLVEQVGPAVVNIRTLEHVRTGASGRGGEGGPN